MGKSGVKAAAAFDYKKVWEHFVEEGFRFPLYVISRPFKAFSDIKYENRGSVFSCVIFLILLCIIKLLNYSYTGYITNPVNIYYVNTFTTILGVLAQSLLFVAANWSVTVLINGSGKFKEIFMVFMYAQYPSLWLNLAYILLSNILTLEEMALATFLTSLGMVLFVFYTFVGLVVVHEFTFTKTVASVILTFVALLIILFILLLLVTMANELITFVKTVYQEIILHYT